MLLYQRGQLDLDTPLGELLPGFVVGRRSGTASLARFTLRHLLAHNSGLPGYVEFFQHRRPLQPPFIAPALELPLEAEPGTRAEYSDPGFILLGKALEVLIREDLATWVRREIFAPLGHVRYGLLPRRFASRLNSAHRNGHNSSPSPIQGEVQDENAWVLKGVAGHAGLFSNVPDLLAFRRRNPESAKVRRLRQPEAIRLFRPETVQLFAQRQGPEGSSRALGWDTPSEKSSSGTHFSPRIHRASGLQRLLIVDRSGRRLRRCPAHQPHLARPDKTG